MSVKQPYKFTKTDKSTFEQLKQYASASTDSAKKGIKIAQASITRLIRKLLKYDDEEKLKEIIPPLLEFEGDRDLGIEYIRKKLRGDEKRKFTALASPYVVSKSKDTEFKGQPRRLDEPTPAPKRDIGKVIESAEEMGEILEPKKQTGKQTGKQGENNMRIIETIMGMKSDYDKAMGLKKEYDKMPGGDLATKYMYYTQPELKMLQDFINKTPLKWTKEDSDYLKNVLDPDYSGPDKDNFRDRIKWVAKLIANPSEWFNTIGKMTWSEIKNSEIGKWFYNTFEKVYTQFNNQKAKELSESFKQTGKLQGTQLDTSGGKITVKDPEKGGEGGKPSPWTAVRPVISQPRAESDADHQKYRTILGGLFKVDKRGYMLDLLSSDPVFKQHFEQIYTKYHKGLNWDNVRQGYDMFGGMNQKEKEHLSYELDREVKESMKRQKLPPQEFELAIEPSDDIRTQSEAGSLIDDTGRTLLEKYVNSIDMMDKKLIDFITRGKGIEGASGLTKVDAVNMHNTLMPTLQKLRDVINDPNARVSSDTIEIIETALDNVPGTVDSELVKTKEDAQKYVSTRLAQDEARRTQTQTQEQEQTKTKTEEDPDDPDKKKYKKEKKPPTQEEVFAGPKRKIPELRPKFGIMGQEELEDVLIGDSEEQERTEYTWQVVDLKHADETMTEADRVDNYQPLFERNTKLYNLRYGETFAMPRVSRPDPEAETVRKLVRDIYQKSHQLVDAYDNTQFRGLNPERLQPPVWENEIREKRNNLSIGGLPVPSIYGGSYKYPQFREPMRPLLNRGKHF